MQTTFKIGQPDHQPVYFHSRQGPRYLGASYREGTVYLVFRIIFIQARVGGLFHLLESAKVGQDLCRGEGVESKGLPHGVWGRTPGR